MKILSRSVLLLLSFLSSPFVFAASSGYLAEGVNADSLADSTRFYDNGKGYYWGYGWAHSSIPQHVSGLYTETGGTGFLGSLAPYLDGQSYTADTLPTALQQTLGQDAYTCWYNVAANLIQYWQSYYGVFYQGSDPLPYGLNYSSSHLAALGGTQSLAVGLAFYENFQNVGGNLSYAAPWYFSGVSTAPLKEGASGGGYFADYFGNGSATCQYSIFWDGNGQQHLDSTTAVFLSEINQHLGLNAEGELETHGQIFQLGISHGTEGGHALTCYGYEVDEAGRVILNLANSDDQSYSLFRAYLQEEGGKLVLYDAATSEPWFFNSGGWYICEMSSIRTPEDLAAMYAQYKENALVWTGALVAWSSDYQKETTEALPTATTGWDAYAASGAHSGYFHSYYDEGRQVEFNDVASNTAVTVKGDVAVQDITISATAKDYTFTGSGKEATSITAEGGLRLTGAGRRPLRTSA